MSTRKQLCGWQKRQKAKNKEELTKRLKGRLRNFLISESECNQNGNETKSVDCYATSSKSLPALNSDEKVSEFPETMELDFNELDATSVLTCSDSDLDSKSVSLLASDVDKVSHEKSSNHNINLEVKLDCSEVDPTSVYSDDPALWPLVITQEMRDYFINKKPDQHISEIESSRKFCTDKIRVLTEHNFYRLNHNNEKIKRDWLIYSPTKAAIFCYVCKLYSSSRQALSYDGFSDWKNVSGRLKEHENSKTHRDSVCALSLRAVSCSRIDKQMVIEYQQECKYWRNVLTRVVATIKFLAARGLPLFGSNETLGSVSNGNFLGCLELIGKFDPFIADHLAKKGNPGKGHVNYLSSTTVIELLQLMSDKVLQYILSEVNKAKYFGLIVDSTPDITHVDQLSVVLRYVNEDGEPNERFIKFLSPNNHTSLSLTTCVIDLLENLNLDILNCRGQSYDNASNMSGQYSGLQARIKQVSPLADFVPCSSHSLNLVGTAAVECCKQAVAFFGIIQSIYNFFSASTHRWKILMKSLECCEDKVSVKSLSNTRWSAEADATKALRKGYLQIQQALYNIHTNELEAAATRHEAGNLYSKMCKFETALLTIIWDTILQRINKTSKVLQSSSTDISSLLPLYNSLIKFINTVRENLDVYEEEAKKLVNGETYSAQRKKHISRRLDSNTETECNFSPKESFRINCHNMICDSLIVQLQKRMEAYSYLEEKFGFLSNSDLSISEKTTSAKRFHEYYSADVEEDFIDEFLQFSPILEQCSSPLECLKKMKSLNISHTFPNIEIALRILLTLPVSNTSSERSFSALKRIKNQMRNSIGQTNLQAFSVLSIESEITSQLDFDDVITDFALKKSRKKEFN